MRTLKSKVSIIGAGNVGSSFAFALMISGIAREIVIIDKDTRRAAGECMDLNHGLSFSHPAAISSGGYEDCADSDIIVITAGAKQKPGQTRTDLVQINVDIFKQIIPQVMKYAKEAIIIVVTNPVDILTYVTLKISGLPTSRAIGSGTALDTSRFRYLISNHCKVDLRNVHAYIIGEHGDTELPVWSNASIGGMRIEKYCPTCKNFGNCDHEKELERLFDEVKDTAYKIIEAKGATYYAVALINDYYGVNDVCLSLPSIVNRSAG